MSKSLFGCSVCASCWMAAVAFLVCLSLPTQARADQILLEAYGYGPGVFNPINVLPFDPSLGTLDSIDVQIFGVISGDVVVPFCSAGLVPCGYLGSLDQSFAGLGGQFFSFGNDSLFVFTGAALPGLVPVVQPYSYSFSFTSFSDMLGSTFLSGFSGPVNPPAIINGTRNDFLLPVAPINEIDNFVDGSSGFADFSDSGSIQIQYNYTPAAPAIPEPASALTVATGLLALISCRRSVRRR